MTHEQANQIKAGDEVTFGPHTYTVASIKTSGIAAPYFRLAQGPEHGLTSYRLCGRVTRNAGIYISTKPDKIATIVEREERA